MPGFNVTEISVLNQIKSNLQDRYGSGFPVLKELLQNADDSGAETICCDFQPGWPQAANPLLRGPGLLVINDGEFRDEDQRGITSFGESGKTTDTAAIGKFGFGQKSVFHLCDAFVIRPEGTQAKASSVVNPFLGVEVIGNVSATWEALSDEDLAYLTQAANDAGFGMRRLILWLPFRRHDLAPAPDAGFSNEMPDGAVLLGQFKQLEALRATLACLRRLCRVELRNKGRLELGLSVSKDADRLLGPKAWTAGVREFAGRLELMPNSAGGAARFIGRESMVGAQVLDDLKSSTEWPKTISVLHPTPQPEKGEPHGAATLVHSADGQRSDLRIQWAVFLPTSDETEIKIDLAPGQGRFTLLLHGYFFLDSGRRRIEAIDDVGDPARERQLRQRWNIELRDQVTLPLIPRLLEDALGAKVIDTAQLATLVGALQTSPWFADHQDAVCKTDQLVRILDASGNIAWRALPASAKVRALPKSVLDAPLRLTELFPHVHEWAQAQNIALCVDPSATLAAGSMDWTAVELAELIPGLSAKAFVSRPVTDLLADFLRLAAPSLAARQVVGPALVAALRRALSGQAPLASSESIRAVLGHVPPLLIFALPMAVEQRAVLRALAEVDADILAVRSEHVDPDRQNPGLSDAAVERLLAALEPLVDDDDHSDQAASAALALLAGAHSNVRQLAEREGLARLKILKARGVKGREVVSVSLQDLVERSRRGLLFGQSPQNANFLPKLVEAVLDADPLVIEGSTMAVLQEMRSGDLRLAFASKDSILPIVRSALRFGEADARGVLLDQLRPTDGDDPMAFRMLCAGNPDAGLPGAKLYQLQGLPAAVEDLVADLLARRSSGFVVPDAVIHRLNGGQKSLLHIGVYDAAKRANEDLTGKFGLGFKSVHVLSDDVGVASGFISLRIRGGLLPDSWTEGLSEVEARRSPQAQKATLVDVPFTGETASDGQLALAAFRSAAPWMPAFSHHIRHIHIDDGEPLTAEGTIIPLLGSNALQVVELRGARRQRALRIDLGDHFHLFLGLDESGATPMPDTLKRLWNLAPLEEEVGSGWVLNGPFAVDPGRGRLSGTIESREERFRRLGRSLGRQLTNLFDLSSSDWRGFATALGLDETSGAQATFWMRLEALFRGDVDDRIAVLLHGEGGGYARLAAERPVTPTGLPPPFPRLIHAKDIEHHLSGALSEPGILGVVSSWPQTALVQARVVSKDTAETLESLGLGGGAPLTLAQVIAGELTADPHLGPAVAHRLGQVISPDTIDDAPLLWERVDVFTALRSALFRAGDDTWRPAQGLTVADAEGGEEQLIARFAPASAVLHESYAGAALGLFRVARRESGYGPRAAQLADWALAADTSERRQAALRYVIEGNQGRAFALELRSKPPAWLPLDGLADNPLLSGWALEDVNRLKAELIGYSHLSFNVLPWSGPTASAPDAGRLFAEVGKWWLAARDDLAPTYQRRLYPAGFSLSQLHDAEDRQAWFTMFALACFQTIGRTMEGQHRSFIEGGMRDGWWLELASSKPPHNAQAWLDRLERWSGPLLQDQQFLSWRRVFVDLYTFARWLDDYTHIMRKLPRVVEHHGPVSLHDILKPSFSPALAALSVDAAPIDRSLGIGVNWLVRELMRSGVYGGDDLARMAPYSFASSERVREGLLGPLGHQVLDGADSDECRRIYAFIEGAAGADTVRFAGDYDLPLQLITRREHHEALRACFEAAGGVPDELDDFLADDEDDAEHDQ